MEDLHFSAERRKKRDLCGTTPHCSRSDLTRQRIRLSWASWDREKRHAKLERGGESW